ncbi:SufE family protein [Shewanella maritima]|uniref:SufE family protein n=1 Tax=Shewanella maritima TaxID=2520507 RepID=A0A411PJS2_9GAMM|nr:SufE family protein [Shewanella maritima]QBF83738.1 SufE family protein [Shewanella maritima]
MSARPTAESSLFAELPPSIFDGVTLIENAKNWQEKYRQIMLLGKQLPELPESLKHESAQVKGCESQAWLYHQLIDGKHYFIASSDARIVKGLIAIILSHTQAKTTKEIADFSISDEFQRLGLSGQLSPSRTNGITALANAIAAFSQE